MTTQITATTALFDPHSSVVSIGYLTAGIACLLFLPVLSAFRAGRRDALAAPSPTRMTIAAWSTIPFLVSAAALLCIFQGIGAHTDRDGQWLMLGYFLLAATSLVTIPHSFDRRATITLRQLALAAWLFTIFLIFSGQFNALLTISAVIIAGANWVLGRNRFAEEAK